MKKAKPEPRRKDPNLYPPGWDLEETKAIADYYDSRKGEPLLADTEPGSAAGQVWVEVPQALLPQVLKIIERGRKTA
jgi:hypothetical protein